MQPITPESNRNFKVASEVMLQTRAILRFGPANNWLDDRYDWSETQDRFEKVRDLTKQHAPSVDPSEYARRITVNARYARQFQAGNCGEHAAVAFKLLEARGIRPLEYAAVMEDKDYLLFRRTSSHAFVIIGRRMHPDIRDISSWGPDAVICDPWANQVKRVQDIGSSKIAGRTRHLYSMHRLEDPRDRLPIPGNRLGTQLAPKWN